MKWNPFKKKKDPVRIIPIPAAVRAFDSSIANRLTADWLSSSNTQNQEISQAIQLTRNRARDLERNNSWVLHGLDYLETQVIGKGQRLRAEPRNTDGKIDQEAKRIIEEAWADFCKPENCEVTGRYSFQDLERLTLRSRKRDGEFLVRIDINSRYKYGFKLQILETDLLDYLLDRQAPNSGNRIRMGVELDSLDRPVAYWMFSSNPNAIQLRQGTRLKHERIPAAKILHGFKPTRIGQVRGITEFASCMQDLKALDAYDEAEIAASRVAACMMFQIVPPPGTEFAGDLPEQNGNQMFSAEPAMVHNASNGKIEPISIQHPTTQMKEMRNGLLRKISAGFNIAFDSLTNDITEANFSNSRLGKLAERDNFRIDQSIQINTFNNPVFEIFLNRALTGAQQVLSPLKPANFIKYSKKCWVPRSYPWVDPVKDVQANILMREQGGVSDEYVIEIGPEEDIESVYGAIAANGELAEDMGLSFGQKQVQETFQADSEVEEPIEENIIEEVPTEEPEEEERGFQEGLIYDINGIDFVFQEGNLKAVK